MLEDLLPFVRMAVLTVQFASILPELVQLLKIWFFSVVDPCEP
jgi:hypothetical protein